MPPYTPNFVFTDQVPASQLMGLAQISQAQDAARQQALLGTLQAIGQQRTARENAAAERYRYQSSADIQRQQLAQQAREAEANRMARSSEVDRTIKSHESIAKMDSDARTSVNTRGRQDATDIEEYNFVLSQVEGADPPTDTEFRSFSMNLSPERAARLDSIRKQNIAALSQAADNADAFASYWNSRIGKLGANNKTGETMESIIAEATKSQAGKFIIYDQATGLFRPTIGRPRAAIKAIAAPPPVGVQGGLGSPALPMAPTPSDIQAFGTSGSSALSGLLPALLPFLRPTPATPPPSMIYNPAAPNIPPGWPQPGYPLQ